MVDHNHNRIKTCTGGQVSNQIHRDLGEGFRGCGRNRGEGRRRRVGIRFHFLAGTTAGNIVADEGTHTRPPVGAFYQLFSLVAAGVAGGDVVMVEGENPATEGVGDVSAVFVEQDATIVVQAPVGEGGAHWWGAEPIEGVNSCRDSRFRGIRGCNCKFLSKFSINETSEEGIREQRDMLVISVGRGMVNATGEGIRGGEVAARDMVKEEVVFREGQLPSSLSSS